MMYWHCNCRAHMVSKYYWSWLAFVYLVKYRRMHGECDNKLKSTMSTGCISFYVTFVVIKGNVKSRNTP